MTNSVVLLVCSFVSRLLMKLVQLGALTRPSPKLLHVAGVSARPTECRRCTLIGLQLSIAPELLICLVWARVLAVSSVVLIRAAPFALVLLMRIMPWTPLVEVRGIGGMGVKFRSPCW